MPFLKSSIFYGRSTILKKGFTLVELLIVITIIGILAGLSLVSYNGTQGKARDATRKSDLRDLQKALQSYYADNNSTYPNTGGAWCSSEPGDVVQNCNSGNYILGLAPTYIPKLPRDPKGGPGNPNLVAGCSAWKSAYLYISDGNNYKLLSHCAAEKTPLSPTDPFFDSVRPAHAWQISTKGAASW